MLVDCEDVEWFCNELICFGDELICWGDELICWGNMVEKFGCVSLGEVMLLCVFELMLRVWGVLKDWGYILMFGLCLEFDWKV